MATEQPKVINRAGPAAVTYDLSDPHRVRITVPAGSRWSSGLHWHETHTEYLRVVSGRARVRLGDVTKVFGASDGEVRVDRSVWHQWEADDGVSTGEGKEEGEGDDLVVEERTEPEDGDKAVFFWNLNGVILSASAKKPGWRVPKWLWGLGLDFWVTLNLFVIFGRLDNVPVFLDLRWWLARLGLRLRPVQGSITAQAIDLVDWAVSHAVLALAGWVGWLFGVQAVAREYTPEAEYRSWIANHGGAEGRKER
jgi:mannose-6-phosphate isomerase-like protein (cupin superfamily)